MTLFSQIQSAAFLQWAEAVCTGPEEDWKTIAIHTLRPVTDKAVFLSSGRTIKGINKVKNQFWKRVLEIWATFDKHRGTKDFMKQPIFNKKYLTYHHESLYNKMCIKNNIISFNDLYNGNDYISLEEFTRKTGMYPARHLDYNLLKFVIT